MSVWRQARPFVVGHRGGRGEGWPDENTVEAFERAAREGALAVELDVRLASDGEVVVLHDADLARVTGGARRERVDALAGAELRRVRLAGGCAPPTLHEALAWARARGVAVNVELKEDVPSRYALADMAARAILQAGVDAIVSSFHPGLVALVAARAPRVRRALLTHARQGRTALLTRALSARPFCAAAHLEAEEATPACVARLRARGLAVGAWTVNDVDAARALLAAGCSYVISDQPGKLAGLAA